MVDGGADVDLYLVSRFCTYYSPIANQDTITNIGQNLLLYQTSSRGFCTRRLVEIFYQMSSSRKIATYQVSFRRSKYLLDIQQQKNSSTRRLVEFLLDAQQNFYQTSRRPDDLGHHDFLETYQITIIVPVFGSKMHAMTLSLPILSSIDNAVAIY